jgi:predicted MPP superfamily phosphohydrolase
MPRHLSIGDIHGCITALTTLVSYVDLREDDVIVTLGDYVDRGPDPAAVVQLILDLHRSHKVISLRGNHELVIAAQRDDIVRLVQIQDELHDRSRVRPAVDVVTQGDNDVIVAKIDIAD